MDWLQWDFCSVSQDSDCSHFSCCCCSVTRRYIKWTFTMTSFMVMWTRKYICSFSWIYSPAACGKVCRLHKSLYGLKQTPPCWFAKLATSLWQYVSLALTLTILVLLTVATLFVWMCLYMLIIIVSRNDSLSSFKHYLGPLKYFLAI